VGEGEMFDESEKIVYKGEFKNSKFDGKGIMYYVNGNIKYDGEFKND
jgi:antitoxin component YwqK of YwqJK toxin-antitoxin module